MVIQLKKNAENWFSNVYELLNFQAKQIYQAY